MSECKGKWQGDSKYQCKQMEGVTRKKKKKGDGDHENTEL